MEALITLIDEAHEAIQERPRAHLGCSGLGHPCDRWVWLNFRLAVIQKFPGRILRLFRRGHLEEPQIIRDLILAGVEVGTDQAAVDFGSHVKGSADLIIERGVLGSPDDRHVAEFKTHALSSFKDVRKNGVKKSKPTHWGQMQLYMLGLKIKKGLYVAVCKNDDQYYIESVDLDHEAAEALVAKGHRLAQAERMPEPISTDPSWYQCKFCPAHDFCHKTKLTQEVNCRTCAHSTARGDSTWHCSQFDDVVPFEFQLKGCDKHVLHPDLVPWQIVASESTPTVAAFDVNGHTLKNGPGHFASSELIANAPACAASETAQIKADFPGAKIYG